MPSIGLVSMFSLTSENSLPSAPMVWMAIASTPAIGPMPNANTKISAYTSSGTARAISSSRRLANTIQPLRTRLRDAAKHSAKPTAAPMVVARNAITTVSNSIRSQRPSPQYHSRASASRPSPVAFGRVRSM